MVELFETFVEWLKSSGFTDITTLVNTGGIFGGIFAVVKVLKKSNAKEILAIAEKQTLSKEFTETSEKINGVEENQKALEQKLDKVIGMFMILLNNAKIPSEAKTQALDLFNCTTKEVKKVADKVSDVVEKIVEVVQEQVETTKKATENTDTTNPYLESIDKLLNEKQN